MSKPRQNRMDRPPFWAETLLRALLAPRSRDAIAGDLMEEYRESVLPAVGTLRAQIWYIRQVLSFLDASALVKVAAKIPSVLLWGAGVWLLGLGLVFTVPYVTGMAVSTVLVLSTGIVLTIGGATAIRTLVKDCSLLRTSFLGFACFATVTAIVASAPIFRPLFMMEAFLAIMTVMGFRGASKTGQVRSGIMTAVGTSISVTALIVLTVRLLHLPHPPLASGVVLPAAAAILGAGGAFFGKRFGYWDVDALILTMNLV